MTARLLDGLAQHLAAAGLGVWRPVGVYLPAEVGIVIETMPHTPTRCVGLFRYGGDEAPVETGMDGTRIQVRVRGDATATWSRDRAQDVYDLLHGAEWLTLPTGDVIELAVGTQSGPIPFGRDSTHRHEHAVNFRAFITNPDR